MVNEDEWYFKRKILPDGRTIYAYPLTFGRARIGISPDYFVGYFDDFW